MGLVEKIKKLCDEQNITFAELERRIGISNGQIRRWDKVSPKNDNLLKVAEHFNVSLDYLNNRTKIRSVVDQNCEEKETHTIAAHIKDDVTEDEMNDIKNFIEFLKSKRH